MPEVVLGGRGGGPLRLGVLASGSGSNLQAILDATREGRLDAVVAVVVSDIGDAFALERARSAGVAAVHVDRAAFASGPAYSAELVRTLVAHDVELVVMAGYMRLLGTSVLHAFPNAVLNLHPALLPSFPGAHGISDAFEYGVKVTGVTVHFASEAFDEGPIVAQEPVAIAEDDTLEALEARIHAAEHRLYPRVIQLIAEGRVSIDGRRVRVADRAD